MSPEAKGRRRFVWLAAAVLLLAAALRFHQLGRQSLWYDEGVAYAHSQRSFAELLPLLRNNVHVPAYFTLLGLWEDVAGASEFSLRALSAFFSIISVAWAYALGKRLCHPIAGLAAAALVAGNAFSIYYAQEARMYAMLAAVAGGSMWFFAGFLRDVSAGMRGRAMIVGALALGLVNAVGIYTHLAYALVMLAQGTLAVLWLFRRQTRRILPAYALASLVSLVLFLPWLPLAVSQVAAQPNIAAAASPGEILGIAQGWFAFGSVYEWRMDGIAFAVYAVLLLGIMGRRDWWRMLLPAAWALVSVLVYLYLELTTRYTRFLLPAQLGFALWMGRGLWVLWMRESRLQWLTKGAALVLGGAFLLILADGWDRLYRHPDFQRDDLRGLARQIEDSLRPGDALLVSAAGLTEALGYYYRADAPLYGLPTSADDEATRRQTLDIIAAHDRIYAIFYGAEEQDPRRVVESTLNRESYEISDAWVGDMRFVQYATAVFLDAPQELDLRFDEGIWLKSYALGARTVRPGDALAVQFVWMAAARLTERYKVFLQLLDGDDLLAAQRDSEPGGGLAMTATWAADAPVMDNHALLIPADLPAGDYTLIVGLYDIHDPMARLPVDGGDYAELGIVRVE